MDEIEFVKNMQVLEIKPGDLIVLRHPMRLSSHAHQQLTDTLRKILDEQGFNNRIVVLEEGMEIGIIRPV